MATGGALLVGPPGLLILKVWLAGSLPPRCCVARYLCSFIFCPSVATYNHYPFRCILDSPGRCVWHLWHWGFFFSALGVGHPLVFANSHTP